MNDPIGDERLAELLDGKLPPEERAELLARLAASRDDFALFAELGAVLREAEEAESPADAPVPAGEPVRVHEPVRVDEPVRPAAPAREAAAPSIRVEPPSVRRQPGWRRPSRWLPVAAILTLAVLSPLLWSRFRGESDRLGAPVALLAARDQGLPDGWMDNPAWRVTRGGNDPKGDAVRAARVGAFHTDLALAIASRDAERTTLLAGKIVGEFDDATAGGTVAPLYEAIGERAGESPAALQEPLAEAGKSAAGLLGEEMVELGAWTEAARLAAARQDTAFFRSSATRRVLRRAAGDAALPAEAQEAAQGLRGANLEAPDWPAIRANADALMRAIGS